MRSEALPSLTAASLGEEHTTPADAIDVLCRLRWNEQDRQIPIGVATVERDHLDREVLCLRLSALPVDGLLHLPLQEILILAGVSS